MGEGELKVSKGKGCGPMVHGDIDSALVVSTYLHCSNGGCGSGGVERRGGGCARIRGASPSSSSSQSSSPSTPTPSCVSR